jgi:dihydroorotase
VYLPLRPAVDREVVCEGLRDSTIDAIATDHVPHAPDLREWPFDDASGGMLGLETALLLVLTELGLPVERVLVHGGPLP